MLKRSYIKSHMCNHSEHLTMPDYLICFPISLQDKNADIKRKKCIPDMQKQPLDNFFHSASEILDNLQVLITGRKALIGALIHKLSFLKLCRKVRRQVCIILNNVVHTLSPLV